MAPAASSCSSWDFAGLAAVVGVIPLPVLGGAGHRLVRQVAASGIRTLSKVYYANNQNMIVVAVSLAFGVIPVVATTSGAGSRPGRHDPRLRHQRGEHRAVLLNVFFNMYLPGSRKSPPTSRPPHRSSSARVSPTEH